jgi:ABC-type Fe3+-hydroxamate transport system substrate-binding protein
MPVFTDQLGRNVEIPSARRIISLVPSQTELLYDLGLDNEVVGITKFCVHPNEWFQSKTRVGGTKDVKIDIIDQLQPDLIIANKEENVKEQVDELAKKYPVWVSDVNSLEDAYEMILQTGVITGKKEIAENLVAQIQQEFAGLRTTNSGLRTAYLIWRDPYMTIGTDTFIHSMLKLAGFENVFGDGVRYPETNVKEIIERNPDIILLSSEPYPFKEKHIEELRSSGIYSKILMVDGEMFSWYGSRLLKAPEYFRKLITQIKDNR